MAATTAGTKTVTHTLAPHLTAATLTTLLATPIESCEVVLVGWTKKRQSLDRAAGCLTRRRP